MFRNHFGPRAQGFVDQAASSPQKLRLTPAPERTILRQRNLRSDKIRWLAEAIDRQQQKIRKPGI